MRHRRGGPVVGRVARGRARTAAAALAVTGALAACGSPSSPATAAASPAAAGQADLAMATSVSTRADTWAVLPMSADPAFWQVLVRAGNSATWKLVTPPGVADNGGLVASAGAVGSLTVAVRPSQHLAFSPLAATADGGASWSAGPPLDAAVAASPGAFAAYGAKLVALLTDGAVETSSDAGATWSVIAKPGAIAASAAGKGCGGAVLLTSVSFVPGTVTSGNAAVTTTGVLAGGTCGAAGGALFSYSPGPGWQRVGLPVPGRLVRLIGGLVLVQGKAGLSALWRRAGWYAYDPLDSPGPPQPAPAGWTGAATLPLSSPVTAAGALRPGGAWALLSGGRAATISGPGQQWTPLPPVPAKTAVLAAGPDGATDALAAAGTTLTVWRLAPQATGWQKTATFSVPIQVGSSG